MSLPFDLEFIKQRPLMWLPSEDFNVVAAYILGMDAACNRALLKGFREWLILKLGRGNNRTWIALVLELAHPDMDDPASALQSEEGQLKAIEQLFLCLEGFFGATAKDRGLRSIYVKYQKWLEGQSWYTDKSPDWIDTDEVR